MIKQLGTKLYYCLLTGNLIKLIGDMQGYIKETTFDEDYEIYTELKERDENSIGLLTFEYGEYPKLSQGSTGVMVDLETKELIFSYDELPMPPQEPNLEDTVQEQGNKILTLETSQTSQDTDIKDNMLACVELCDMVLTLMETQPQMFNTKGVVSHLSRIYFKLIVSGDLLVEDVPDKYRSEVEGLLQSQ